MEEQEQRRRTEDFSPPSFSTNLLPSSAVLALPFATLPPFDNAAQGGRVIASEWYQVGETEGIWQ